MAPRPSKRQQRELEELEALAGPSKLRNDLDLEGESEEYEGPLSGGGTVRGFAALAGDGEREGDEEPGEDDRPKLVAKSKKSTKKKKKGAVSSDHGLPSSPQPKSNTRKKTKEVPKSKGKMRTDDVDFDKALAELSGKHLNLHDDPGSVKTSVSVPLFDAFNSLLSVTLKNLDPETELRRFFGSKVISSSVSTQKTSRAQTSGRSHLARQQPTWPPPHYRAGLSMRPLISDEVHAKGTGAGPDSRERWWTVEASPRYKGTTYEFMQCVMGGDPQLFFNLLQEMPWHTDTLLQTAEVFRHREEYSTAADFLSRALFAYERAFVAAFNLTTGIHRLDFDHVENRVFYLALSRNVVDLNRRGTPRTAFEFARLLFALDPHTDPHGALLQLDCLAIKASQGKWLLDMWDTCDKLRGIKENAEDTRFDVTMMPGWCWARALALFEKEGDQAHEASSQALIDAILAFPSVAPLLADKADIAMPAELRKLHTFKIVTDHNSYYDDQPTTIIHLLSHIYAMRSASLWKQASHATWLSDTFKTLVTQLPDIFTGPVPPARKRLYALFSQQSNLTDAIYRHVAVVAPLVPEFRRLFPFFPQEVKERLTQTIEGDPLPPVTAVSTYNDAYFVSVGVEGRTRMRDRLAPELHRPLANMLDHRQLQAIFDAHPEVAAQFPGGPDELAQMARQFPQEVLEAMVMMVGQGGDHPAGEVDDGIMPGGEAVFTENVERDVPPVAPGSGDVSQGEDEVHDDEEYDQPFLPVRILQNLLGRLWGRGSQEDSDSEGEGGGGAQNEPREGPRADDVD